MRKLPKTISSNLNAHRAIIVVAVIIFGMIGGYLLASTRAASPVASIEAEAGSASTNVSVVSDTSASVGKAIRFGSGVAGCIVPSDIPAGFPSACTTGYKPTGVVLVAATAATKPATNVGWHASGDNVIIDSNGAVIDGIDVRGSVYDSSGRSNVTIKNSWIHCHDEHSTCVELYGSYSSIVDTEIGGDLSGTGFTDSVNVRSGGPGNVLRRVYLHHSLSAFRATSQTLLVDSFISDPPMGDPIVKQDGSISYDDHSGGSFIENGQDITYDHNSIQGGNSAGIFVQDYDQSLPGQKNIVIKNNYLFMRVRNGQDSTWGISIENKFIKGPITVINNTFGTGWGAGPMLLPESTAAHPLSITYSGNVYVDGSPANPEFHPFQF